MDLSRIIDELRAQRAHLEQAISALEGANSAGRRGRTAGTKPTTTKRRRGHMSAAGRRKLSRLMKQRWAQGKMKSRAKAA